MNFSITATTKLNKNHTLAIFRVSIRDLILQDNIIRDTKIMISKKVVKTLNYSD